MYYCIPWSYVCDNKWDCPHGYDELNETCSTNRECTNMFKCRNSIRCVHMGDVCNGNMDCPERDDEQLCALNYLPCPSSCYCLTFVIKCSQLKTCQFAFYPTLLYQLALTIVKSNYVSKIIGKI